ncbi:MAG: cell division protein FtsZ [bacterium]|nr:cell division protein FtsZ [bacterium]
MAKAKRRKGEKALRPKIAREPAVKLQELGDDVPRTRIRIIGVGGGGGNIVSEIAKLVGRIDFVGANTDLQALKTLSKNVKRFSFGEDLTQGLGCGMDVVKGEEAARMEKERIKNMMQGQDICILVASLGGGTGSGSAPVFAEVSRELKNLTLGIFCMPFSFEGEKRRQIADRALEKLKPILNSYVLIPNENIFRMIDAKTSLKESLSMVNKLLAETLKGFIETLSLPGLINIDFADVRTLLEGRGRLAYLHSATGSGPTKAQTSLKEVLVNPLGDYGIVGADRIMFNITGDKNLKMQDVSEIARTIAAGNPRAKIIFGISFQPEFKDKVRIALFAVGCKEGRGGEKQKPSVKKKPQKPRAKAQGKLLLVTQKKKAQPAPKEEHKAVALENASLQDSSKLRRNALDLKKAVEEEIQELEKKEKAWDIPSFLRNKPAS